MKRVFTMPDAGEGLADAEIVSWLVGVGEEAREDQDLVTVETAKAIISLPCPVNGVLVERHGEEGDTVAVGDVLAVFEVESAAGSMTTNRSTGSPAAGSQRSGAAQTAAPATRFTLTDRPAASPAVRRRARELGIDLATVRGSGPGDRIVAADLAQHRSDGAGAPSSSPTPDETALRGLRRTVGEVMTAGWQTIPHIFDFREADATRLLQARSLLREQAGKAGDTELVEALSPLPLLVKIAAVALERHPRLHGFVDKDRQVIVSHRRCHLGIAVATPDGLVTPVLTDADRRSLPDLARELRALTDAARARTLTPEQLAGATFLVNNLGALGTRFGTPLIPPGLGGNVGFGRITERPAVRAGEVVAAPVLPLSISADHRLVDGDVLAAFAGTVVELVEDPILLLGGGGGW